MNVRNLQTALGVTADGVAGLATYTALFSKLKAPPARSEALAVAANRWFPEFGIMDSSLRLAHFMAQLCHESGSFQYMEEIASGVAYEGRKDLGNIQPGDGRKFKGRGPIQITGRANYRAYGRLAGLDLVQFPELAANPSIGLLLALLYWRKNGLNTLADSDNIKAITKLINGGYNGLADREKYLNQIKGWLA